MALLQGGLRGGQRYNDEDYYGGGRDDYRQNDYRQDDYYDDRGRSSSRPSSTPSLQLPSMIKNGDRKIGLMLLGSGAAITMLGISLFFNKSLMRLGNLLFIAGVPMTIGPSRTMGYFLQKQKMRATACLGLGIFLVFVGHPVFGMALEVFGLLNLFGNMFPVLMAILKQTPVVGPLLSQTSNNNKSRSKRSRYDDDDDRGYDDRGYNGRSYDDRGGYDDRTYPDDDYYYNDDNGRRGNDRFY